MARVPTLALPLALVLVACGTTPPDSSSSSPASPPSASSVTASAAVGSSPPSAPPSASPSPRPSLVAGGPIVELAVARMAKDPFVTRIEQTNSQSMTADTGSAEMSGITRGQISGKDLDLTITAKSGATDLSSHLILVGDAMYASQGGGPWQVGTRAQGGQVIDQILIIMRWMPPAEQLADLGEETLDGTTVHHLTETQLVMYEDFAGGENTFETFDLWVLPDGTPVLRKATVKGVMGTLVSHGVTETRFSGFGLPFEIRPPKLPPSPEPSKRPARP